LAARLLPKHELLAAVADAVALCFNAPMTLDERLALAREIKQQGTGK
jgi:hypothetical protein